MIKWTSASQICRLGAEACLFLFIHRLKVNYLPVSSFCQENHYCMWQVRALWFFLFFWPRRQRHPASVRVISVSLSWGGFKASSALDFGCTYYKACINICIQFIHTISMKPSVFERTKSYDAFIPTLMKHNRYLSSSQLWCDLILLVFPIKDQEPPPPPHPSSPSFIQGQLSSSQLSVFLWQKAADNRAIGTDGRTADSKNSWF